MGAGLGPRPPSCSRLLRSQLGAAGARSLCLHPTSAGPRLQGCHPPRAYPSPLHFSFLSPFPATLVLFSSRREHAALERGAELLYAKRRHWGGLSGVPCSPLPVLGLAYSASSTEHQGSAVRPSVTPRPLPLRVETGSEPVSVQICFLGFREHRPGSWGLGKECAPAFHRQMKTRLYLPCFWLFSPGQQSAAPRCSRGGREPCVTVEGVEVLEKSTEAGPSPCMGLLIWE